MSNSVVSFANSKIGIPYLWGGTTDRGYDCSGLSQAAYASAGVTIPRVAADQYKQADKVSRNNLVAGDLVFFRTDDSNPNSISHVGIYNGDGTFTHAPRTGTTIRIDSLDNSYYSSRFAGGGRYVSFPTTGTAAGSTTSTTAKPITGKIITVLSVVAILILAAIFFMKAFDLKII